MINTKKLLLVLLTLVCAACAAFAVAACNPDDTGEPDIPGLGDNVSIQLGRDNIEFAKGMEVDTPDIIVRCGCILVDNDSKLQVTVTEGHLESGAVYYENFDLSTAGSDKKIKIKYKSAECFITYNVTEYSVNFYLGEGRTERWKSVSAAAELSSSLELSVSVDLGAFNYSTDHAARTSDAARALRFNGWYNDSDSPVRGVKRVTAEETSNGAVNFHAHFLTEGEFADYEISYDNRGRRVFSGYKGANVASLSVPEGVTYVSFTDLFSTTSQPAALKFEGLRLPSTVKLDLPFSRVINTTGLKSITVDEANPDFSSYNGALYSKNYKILYLMPANCPSGSFHEGLEEFGSYSCAYWHTDTLVIPEGVNVLQYYCFAYSDISKVEGIENVKTIMSGVFVGTDMSVDHGIALYTLEADGDKPKYSLSLILDKTITEYKVIEGTVGIAGGAFSGCDKLEAVDLGDELVSIGSSAFSGCSSLKSITLPKTLKTAGSALFYNCSSLESVYVNSDIGYYDGEDFVGEAIPDDTFYGCSSLNSISLTEGLKYIGNDAFNGCSSLTELAIPNSVQVIGSRAFYNCGITELRLPSSLVLLGKAAFSHCKMEEVDLSVCPSLEALPENCFEYTSLVSVTIPARFSELPAFCFYYTRSLQSVTLGNVTKLGERVFGYCNQLTEIVWSGKLEEIGSRAFTNCTALTRLVIPDSVTKIDGYAFQNCTSLEALTLGRGVKSFGSYAFEADGKTFGTVQPALYTCNNLTEINVAAGNTEFTSVDGVLYASSVGGRSFGAASVLIAVPQRYKNTTLALPSSVRVITPYAVHNQSVLKTVTLNNGLENIGKAAFYNSSSLTSLKIPATVTNIGASIILNCANVSSFTIDEANAVYSSDGNLIYTGDVLIMYMGLSKDVRVREGTVKINDAVFMNNTVIESVVIPDSVTSIGLKAFNGCSKLKSITIGSGLKELASDAFAALPSLERITVAGGNTHYRAENNIMYSKDGKTLLLCAAKNGLTTLDIASGVTEIGDWAFSYHDTLRFAVIPEGVVSIGAYAFYECRAMEYFYGSQTLQSLGERVLSFATSVNPSDKTETRHCDVLKTVMLYGSVKTIGNYAFYGQYGIESAYFKATVEETYAMLASGGTNITYLTHGCPAGNTGTFYNNITSYLYLETPPDDFTINVDGYEWFFISVDGHPEPWKKQ